ncbi:MAG: hypothetical protein ACFFAS_05465 [Promethearchaeota archaeon]
MRPVKNGKKVSDDNRFSYRNYYHCSYSSNIYDIFRIRLYLRLDNEE